MDTGLVPVASVLSRRWKRIACTTVWAGLCVAVIVAGLWLRDWTWRTCEPIRAVGNIQNAFRWGSRAIDWGHDPASGVESAGAAVTWGGTFRGYLSVYDKADVDPEFRGSKRLDYPPLRLLVATLWVKHIRASHPDATQWKPEYSDFMLHLNTFFAATAAAGALLLVRECIARAAGDDSSAIRGWLAGSVAAALIWLNPAVILESHGWPQWDIWPMPFFLWAIWMTLRDRWACAGILLALGALLKGQLLLVAPTLLFWALFGAQWRAAARLALGFSTTALLILSPWLVTAWWGWALVALCVALPVAGVCWFRRRAWMPLAAAGGLVCGLLIAAFVGGGSMAWYRVGFVNGTEKYPRMSRNAACNLPALLSKRYGWRLEDPVIQFPADSRLARLCGNSISMKRFLATLYIAGMLCCGWAAARHAKRRDPRWLIALVTPWVLMFTLLGQMDGRYLLYGACATVVAVVIDAGLVLLHLLLSLMNMAMMLKFLVDSHRRIFPEFYRMLSPLEPDMGWVVILAAGALFYAALRQSGRQTGKTATNRI